MGEGGERRNQASWEAVPIEKLPKEIANIASQWPKFKDICTSGSHWLVNKIYRVSINLKDGTRTVISVTESQIQSEKKKRD